MVRVPARNRLCCSENLDASVGCQRGANQRILGIEPDNDLEHSRKAVDSKLVRARWMDKVGYR